MSTPKVMVQGDTIEWNVTLSDYPADAWQLEYTFYNPVGNFKLTGGIDGTSYAFKLAAVDSAKLVPGGYDWNAKVTDLATGLEVHTIGVGETLVQPDVSKLNFYDNRSWAETALENVEAVIANRATLDQESYSIAGRALSRTPIADLINLRRYLQGEVSTQNDAINGTNSKKAVVRF